MGLTNLEISASEDGDCFAYVRAHYFSFSIKKHAMLFKDIKVNIQRVKRMESDCLGGGQGMRSKAGDSFYFFNSTPCRILCLFKLCTCIILI